jgi:hypothetical protein
MKLTEEQFCKMVQEFEGEPINKIGQIAWRKYSGKNLKEFIEHCIEFNNVVLADVSFSKIEAYALYCIEIDRKGMSPLMYKDYLEIG